MIQCEVMEDLGLLGLNNIQHITSLHTIAASTEAAIVYLYLSFFISIQLNISPSGQ